MKKELDAACIKCGGRLWYVYTRSRRCVECSNKQAENYVSVKRTELSRLQSEVKQLRDELEILTHAVEERRLDYELLTEHYRELLADLAAIRARGE